MYCNAKQNLSRKPNCNFHSTIPIKMLKTDRKHYLYTWSFIVSHLTSNDQHHSLFSLPFNFIYLILDWSSLVYWSSSTHTNPKQFTIVFYKLNCCFLSIQSTFSAAMPQESNLLSSMLFTGTLIWTQHHQKHVKPFFATNFLTL